MLKSILSIIFIFFLVSGSYLTSSYIDRQYPRTSMEKMLYLPSGQFLKGAALSFDEMLADILWIKTIGYFGGHAVTDRNFSWLKHLLNVTTILDPYFEYPHEFGAILLMTELDDVDSAIAILEKGMKNVPTTHNRYWYLPFYIAFNQMYYKKDFIKAAHYLEIASKFPDTPAYLPLLVSRLYANADAPEIAEIFLKEMINTTDNSDLKEVLKKRLNIILTEKNIKLLEHAKQQYFLAYKKFPEKLELLVEKGIITRIPLDPMGGNYYISTEDYSIHSTQKIEKLKVHLYKNTNLDIEVKPAQ